MKENETPTETCSPQATNCPVYGKGALSILLSNAYQEYRHLAIDRQNIQLTYIKTYITLTTIIIGAVLSAAIFLKITQNGILPLPETWAGVICIFFVGVSLFTSLTVFICAVDILNGRTSRHVPFVKIGLSYEWVKSNKNYTEEQLESELLESLIQSVIKGIKDSEDMVDRIGKKLRNMSRLLIISTISGLIGIAIRIFSS